VSRRPNFFHPDDVPLRTPDEMFPLWWEGNVPDLWYQDNATILLALSVDNVSVNDDFMTKF
jgi:hypothetical protein